MRRLQESILYLLLHLTVLFNIERIDIGGVNTIDLATPVYVLTIVAVILILSIRWLKTLYQPTLLLLWAAVYVAMKLMLISQRPLVGGIYTYVSFTELGLFIIAVFLAQNLAVNMDEFEQAVKNFAFAKDTTIKQVHEAQGKIQAEIYRSRRFQRPLSIIVLEKDWNKAHTNFNTVVQDAQRALIEQYVSTMMIRDLSSQLRQTDLLLEHDKQERLIIVSPDTDQAGVKNLINRLGSMTQSGALSINFGAATFPNHGLTFEQLLEQAENSLQERLNRINLEVSETIEKDQAMRIE